MDCLLSVLASCLFSPSHVALRLDSQWLVTHRDFYWIDSETPYRGPLARVELMAGGNLSRSVRLYYGVGHQSFIDTARDHGHEYVIAGVEWHPFR